MFVIHNAGVTRTDGEMDCIEVIHALDDMGIKAIGFCYYHAQDLARAVDPESKNLYIGFDSPTQDDSEALIVANKIIKALNNQGFQTLWNGTIDQRILIEYIDWKKIPDEQDWGQQRVINLMSTNSKKKKPFWKFW